MVEIDQPACARGGCVGICPHDALQLRFGELILDRAACNECTLCVALCPVGGMAAPEA